MPPQPCLFLPTPSPLSALGQQVALTPPPETFRMLQLHARLAIAELTKPATGTVKVGAYKGSVFFLSMSGVQKSLYNEADSSMEASDGLNPVSSQGYAEIQAVEARSLALAGQISSRP